MENRVPTLPGTDGEIHFNISPRQMNTIGQRCLSDNSLHIHSALSAVEWSKTTSTPSVCQNRRSFDDSGYHGSLLERDLVTPSVHSDTPSIAESLHLDDRISTPATRSGHHDESLTFLDLCHSEQFSSTPFFSPILRRADNTRLSRQRLNSHSSLAPRCFRKPLPKLDLDIIEHDDVHSSEFSHPVSATRTFDVGSIEDASPTQSTHLSDSGYDTSTTSLSVNQKRSIPSLCDSIKELPEEFSNFINDTVLDRLIGRKMALEHVDILAELDARNISSCVSLILSYLSTSDLCRMHQVSQEYKCLCSRDKHSSARLASAKRRRRLAGSHAQKDQENMVMVTKSVSTKGSPGSRLGSHRQPLATCQQTVESSPNYKTCTQEAGKRSFDTFIQAASQLRSDESLDKCPRCESPSRVLPAQDRAACFNKRCSYDFCVKCRLAFHGAAACTATKRLPSSATVCTRKSRRNLKRL